MKKFKVSGFTLIELIMVIVILGIMGAVSVKFISHSAQGLVDTGERQALASSATIAVEKVLREVRRALPNSVRIFSDSGNACLEFVPILYSSEYLSIPIASAGTSFQSIQFVNAVGNETGYVAVYPNSETSVYESNKAISSTTAVASPVGVAGSANENLQTLTFSSASSYHFLTDSPEKRFYLVSQPVSFCDDANGRLWRYQNYGFHLDSTGSIPTTGANRSLIADSLAVGSLEFNITPPQLQRNAVVRMSLTIVRPNDTTESINVSQEVQLRNVP
jgi:MSHA biogenesis protein MshO